MTEGGHGSKRGCRFGQYETVTDPFVQRHLQKSCGVADQEGHLLGGRGTGTPDEHDAAVMAENNQLAVGEGATTGGDRRPCPLARGVKRERDRHGVIPCCAVELVAAD
jgi:hypothetical protein